jgi:predicted hydrocarbon binding protein
MIYPTIILDNFFQEPEKIVEFSNKLKYTKDELGTYPGVRSELLHLNHRSFFEKVGKKILKVLYPSIKQITFNCALSFQKISNEYKTKGWVHNDEQDDFTAIVYLSKHKNCGTSIFESKEFSPNFSSLKKRDMYKNKNFEDNLKYLDIHNNQFEETINIKSKFNRLIIFDGAQYHAAQKFIEDGVNEDRLTLIGFFSNVHFQEIKYAGVEHERF